jgi:hypothetical protein
MGFKTSGLFEDGPGSLPRRIFGMYCLLKASAISRALCRAESEYTNSSRIESR